MTPLRYSAAAWVALIKGGNARADKLSADERAAVAKPGAAASCWLKPVTPAPPIWSFVSRRTRQGRVRLTKRFLSGSFFKLTHHRRLTPRTKKEQCSSYVPISGGGHVEDIRGRGCGAGIDHAVRRDDRGLGAGDSPALRLVPG